MNNKRKMKKKKKKNRVVVPVAAAMPDGVSLPGQISPQVCGKQLVAWQMCSFASQQEKGISCSSHSHRPHLIIYLDSGVPSTRLHKMMFRQQAKFMSGLIMVSGMQYCYGPQGSHCTNEE
jgi:hypothetical protein